MRFGGGRWAVRRYGRRASKSVTKYMATVAAPATVDGLIDRLND